MALKVHISTFYPFVNGLENTTAKVLNTIYNCEAVGSEVIINIQWSSIIFDKTKHYWQPNHFVSLVDKTKKIINLILIAIELYYLTMMKMIVMNL